MVIPPMPVKCSGFPTHTHFPLKQWHTLFPIPNKSLSIPTPFPHDCGILQQYPILGSSLSLASHPPTVRGLGYFLYQCHWLPGGPWHQCWRSWCHKDWQEAAENDVFRAKTGRPSRLWLTFAPSPQSIRRPPHRYGHHGNCHKVQRPW